MSSLAKPQELVGVLASNNFLENPEKLLEAKVPGPEHLLVRDGVIYTALHNGDVVKIVGDDVKVLGKFGKLCCELMASLKVSAHEFIKFCRRR